MQVGDVVQITLEGMAYGGEAFGRAEDGRMVFVPFALPSERWAVELTEVHARWARGRATERTGSSPARIAPRCAHYAECGGCHYQHMAYTNQLETKTAIVRDQLQRIGKIESPPVSSMVAAPDPWNYRNRLRFHLRSRGELGFFDIAGKHVLAIEECHLPAKNIALAWPQLSFEPDTGVEEVELRLDHGGQLLLCLHGDGPPRSEMEIEMQASVVWLDRDGNSQVLAGDHFGWMQVKDRSFRVSAGSFFQTQPALTDQLVDLVLDLASIQSGQQVFDLYAGVGLFSLFLAEAGAAVSAVEASASACADFSLNLDPYPDISLYQSDVEYALPSLPIEPLAIVVDPPRAGLPLTVVDEIARRQPERLVYVSCDPATLARDGKRLVEHGFQLKQVVPIDMFPQTFHIETVSLWTPEIN